MKASNSKNETYWSMGNRNNNNEKDEYGTVSPSAQNEFIISDEEDNVSNRIPLTNKMLKVKPKLKNSPNARIQNKSKHKFTPKFLEDRYITKFSLLNLSDFIIRFIHYIVYILSSILSYLIYGSLSLISEWFQNLIQILPNPSTKKLYIWCSLKKSRKLSINGYSTHLQKTHSEENSAIYLTSWPLWLIGLTCILIFFLGYYYAIPHTNIQMNYQNGYTQFRNLINLLKYNIFNLPGSECMINESCCCTNSMIVRRWLYCLFTLPYRVLRSGIHSPIYEDDLLEKNLKKLSDWRLRRNIKRVRTIINDIRSKIFIIGRKANQAEIHIRHFTDDHMKYLRSVLSLLASQEKLENEKDEYVRNVKDMSAQTNKFVHIRQKLEKEKSEVNQYTKCTSKTLTAEIEKTVISDREFLKELTKKINYLQRKAHEKFIGASINHVLGNLKKNILLMQNENTKYLVKLPHLKDIVNKFQSEFEILQNHVMNRSKTEMEKVSHSNRELMNQIETIISVNLENSTNVLNKQKPNITQIVKDAFNIKFKQIKMNIIEESCPKIKDYLHMTILSTLILDNIKSCGIVNHVAYSNQTCLRNMFKYFDKNSQILNCCQKKSRILRRIDERLEIFNSDYIGLVDYALVANGGQVLESQTTMSFYYKDIEEDDESFITAWKPWFLFSKKILNSVNLLNNGKVQAGQCWKFKGNNGSTVIKLAQVILVTTITLDHIHPNLSLSKNYSDAPLRFRIYSLEKENDVRGILLGDFYFEKLEESSIQQFIIKEPIRSQFIRLTIISNHGSNYTCVYRFRIHGRQKE